MVKSETERDFYWLCRKLDGGLINSVKGNIVVKSSVISYDYMWFMVIGRMPLA